MFFRRAKNESNNKQAAAPIESEPDVPLAREVEEVMVEIMKGWEFMTQDEFNPVTLALDLLDNTSQSRDLTTFYALLGKLEKAMDYIVNDHYQAFHNSIETFGSVVENIAQSQNQVHLLKTDLFRCKTLLHCKRTDLLELWAKSVQYKEMLRLLEGIDELRRIPERIELLIQSKHYLTAVQTLLNAIKMISGSDYAAIGALADIKELLFQLRDTMHEKMIDDLHLYLYMKSPYCDESLFADHPSSALFEALTILEPSPKKASGAEKKHKRFRSDIVASLTQRTRGDTLKADSKDRGLEDIMPQEDLDRNPETAPLKHIHVIVAALELLGKLGDVTTVIKQRLPLEMYKITDRVMAELNQRWSDHSLDPFALQGQNSAENKARLVPHVQTHSIHLFEDFILNLCRRFSLIMQMHAYVIRTFHNLVSQFDRKNGVSEKEKRSVRLNMSDTWNAIQQEIIGILSEHLTDSFRSLPPMAINLELSTTKDRASTGRRTLFKFSNSLASSDPGNIKLSTEKVVGVVDILSNNVEAGGRRTIITPTIYNLPSMLKPILEFQSKVERVYFPNSEKKNDIDGFLNETLLAGFLPHVEDLIAQKFHVYVSGPDAFRAEKADNCSKQVFRSAVKILELIKDLCVLVYKIPIHQENFVSIIEMIITKYSEKCLAKFKACLESNSDTEQDFAIISTLWVQDEDIVKYLHQNTYLSEEQTFDPSLNDMLSKKEMHQELKLKNGKLLERGELILDLKRIEFLANIRYSLIWFVEQIDNLRKKGSKKKTSINILPPSEIESLSHNIFEAMTVADGIVSSQDEYSEKYLREAITLSLEEETSRHWNELLEDLLSLSESALFILRVEMRCHCIFYLEQSLREGNYALDSPVFDPDSNIVALNSDLMGCEQVIGRSLPRNETMFIFDGLAVLVMHIMFSAPKSMQSLSKHGVSKMIKNILALQQNLSNLSLAYESRLDHALKFYQTFNTNSEEMYKMIEDNGPAYSFDEYKLVLDLLYKRYFNLADHPQKKIYDEAIKRVKKVCL